MRTLAVIVLSLASAATHFSAATFPTTDKAGFLRPGREHLKWITLAPVANFHSAAPFSAADRAEFLKSGKEHHKWIKGMPLPESLKDAGLLDDAELVWAGLYFDGGSRGFLVKDSAGNYLAFCTGPGFQAPDNPRPIDAKPVSRFFIGGLHYTHEAAQLVEAGSECEQLLQKLSEPKKEITDDPANAKLMASRALPLAEMATKQARIR
jgi:hypothetical protein